MTPRGPSPAALAWGARAPLLREGPRRGRCARRPAACRLEKLYEIEAEAQSGEPDNVLEVRQQKSRPVYDALLKWANVHRPHEPPSSAMGKAIQYIINNHLALTRFLDDGVIPIDNGVVERLHVRTAVTRRTFLLPEATPVPSAQPSPTPCWVHAPSTTSTPSSTSPTCCLDSHDALLFERPGTSHSSSPWFCVLSGRC